MFYYIIDGKILAYSTLLDRALYNYPMLNAEQKAFYLANPGATVQEVLTLTLTPVVNPTLEEYRASRISQYSQMSFDIRRRTYDDYKLINAALGSIYSIEINTDILNCVKAYRDEFYRLQSEVNAARSIEEIDNIIDNFESLSW